MRHPRSSPIRLHLGSVLIPHHAVKADHRADAENDDRRRGPGQIFAEEQRLPPRGRQQPVVQRLVQHFAAEQIHEDAQTTEEDRQRQVEVLEDCGKDGTVFFKIHERLAANVNKQAVGEVKIHPPPAVIVREPVVFAVFFPVFPIALADRLAEPLAHLVQSLPFRHGVQLLPGGDPLGPALALPRRVQPVAYEDHQRKQGEGVDPEGALGEKRPAQLKARDQQRLAQPERERHERPPCPIRYS